MPRKLGTKFYKQILADPDVESNFCSYMQQMMEAGSGASLINDDYGHWAIAETGMQNCPNSRDYDKRNERWKPFDVTTTLFIDKSDFAESIGAALKQFAQRCLC